MCLWRAASVSSVPWAGAPPEDADVQDALPANSEGSDDGSSSNVPDTKVKASALCTCYEQFIEIR